MVDISPDRRLEGPGLGHAIRWLSSAYVLGLGLRRKAMQLVALCLCYEMSVLVLLPDLLPLLQLQLHRTTKEFFLATEHHVRYFPEPTHRFSLFIVPEANGTVLPIPYDRFVNIASPFEGNEAEQI